MQFLKKLNQKFPQNYIIRKPLQGFLVMAFFIFGFVLLYKPLGAHNARSLGFTSTMAIYSFLAALFVPLIGKLLKSFKYFSDKNRWTILKELIAIVAVLTGFGIGIYVLGFMLEEPGARWNLATFFDSVKNAFLVGIIPFVFFSAIGFSRYFSKTADDSSLENEEENFGQLIHINSKLKKEELSFYSEQFIYAASDRNYIDFFLEGKKGVVKKTIRNSMTNIEEQLNRYPHFFRTHRAFLVNLKKIEQKQGNALGYDLKLASINEKIPVARNKIKAFDKQLGKLTRKMHEFS